LSKHVKNRGVKFGGFQWWKPKGLNCSIRS